jgi:hypothetical protein
VKHVLFIVATLSTIGGAFSAYCRVQHFETIVLTTALVTVVSMTAQYVIRLIESWDQYRRLRMAETAMHQFNYTNHT